MNTHPSTRQKRRHRITLSAVLTGFLALGVSGQAPAPGTVMPVTRAAPGTTIPGATPGYAQPTYTQPKYGTSQPTYGPNTAAGTAANQPVPPVGSGTAINSSPPNSAGPFPQDIYRFSQSGAVRTPVPMPSVNFQTTPTGTFTPIPAH